MNQLPTQKEVLEVRSFCLSVCLSVCGIVVPEQVNRFQCGFYYSKVGTCKMVFRYISSAHAFSLSFAFFISTLRKNYYRRYSLHIGESTHEQVAYGAYWGIDRRYIHHDANTEVTFLFLLIASFSKRLFKYRYMYI